MPANHSLATLPSFRQQSAEINNTCRRKVYRVYRPVARTVMGMLPTRRCRDAMRSVAGERGPIVPGEALEADLKPVLLASSFLYLSYPSKSLLISGGVCRDSFAAAKFLFAGCPLHPSTSRQVTLGLLY